MKVVTYKCETRRPNNAPLGGDGKDETSCPGSNRRNREEEGKGVLSRPCSGHCSRRDRQRSGSSRHFPCLSKGRDLGASD